MTDLKALRREIAEKVYADRPWADPEVEMDLIESALLQYAEAVLGEPSEGMVDSRDGYTNRTIWIAMAAQRMKEIK